MEPGDRMLRLVEDLDRKLRSLCGAIEARDAADIRRLAEALADAAREDAGCDLIGLEDDALEDESLLDEMDMSSVSERAEELVSFCRAAMESCEPMDGFELPDHDHDHGHGHGHGHDQLRRGHGDDEDPDA
jgi:hypothetical protein